MIRYSLIALSLFVSLAPTSFADGRMISVKGEKAANLMDALAKAGAKSPSHVKLSYEISEVSCSEGGGFAFLPMHCSLRDSRTQNELRAGEELADALEQAGVKPTHVHQGELNETTLRASDVYCGPGLEDRTQCTIEL